MCKREVILIGLSTFIFLYINQSWPMVRLLREQKLSPRTIKNSRTFSHQMKENQNLSEGLTPNNPNESKTTLSSSTIGADAIAFMKNAWSHVKKSLPRFSPESPHHKNLYSLEDKFNEQIPVLIEKLFSDPSKVEEILMINFVMSISHRNLSLLQKGLHKLHWLLLGTTIGKNIFAHTYIEEKESNLIQEFVEWKKKNKYSEKLPGNNFYEEKLKLVLNVFNFNFMLSEEKFYAITITDIKKVWPEKFLEWLIDITKKSPTSVNVQQEKE